MGNFDFFVNSFFKHCLQPDQTYMAVLFWDLGKSDLSSVSYSTCVHWTSHFLQGTRKRRPCIIGHLVHTPLHEKLDALQHLVSEEHVNGGGLLIIFISIIQGDQLHIAVLFWYLVKSDLSSIRFCTGTYTSVIFYKVPEQHGHVYLVEFFHH